LEGIDSALVCKGVSMKKGGEYEKNLRTTVSAGCTFLTGDRCSRAET